MDSRKTTCRQTAPVSRSVRKPVRQGARETKGSDAPDEGGIGNIGGGREFRRFIGLATEGGGAVGRSAERARGGGGGDLGVGKQLRERLGHGFPPGDARVGRIEDGDLR